MAMVEFYDLHCHFLPGMDDGCQSAEESVSLLEEQYRQGCRGVAATPHYYAVESIDDFLSRRRQAAGRLLAALQARKPAPAIPAICFGAEVAFRESLEADGKLERLCYGRSRYLLLEMPFTPWTDRTVRSVERIISIAGITPVIAHIERYTEIADQCYINALMDLNVLVQLNAENFAGGSKERKAMRMIREGDIQILGTDSHNMTSRPPNMEKAIGSLEQHRMGAELETILQANEVVFRTAMGV